MNSKAMEFEEHYDPLRFPVRVGNVTGWKAMGVDILSFDTEAGKNAVHSWEP